MSPAASFTQRRNAVAPTAFGVLENVLGSARFQRAGWKARPLLRIRYGSKDDVGAGAPSRRRPTARGRAVSIATALRTTRSTLAILRDEAPLLSLAENRGAGE